MTAEQIFSQVLDLMFSGKTEMEEFSNGFLCQLNLKLADTFQQNNAIRAKHGQGALEEIPVISRMTEDVPYEKELTGSLLAYGIAGDLFVEDDETGISNVYRERYLMGLEELAMTEWDEVQDG